MMNALCPELLPVKTSLTDDAPAMVGGETAVTVFKTNGIPFCVIDPVKSILFADSVPVTDSELPTATPFEPNVIIFEEFDMPIKIFSVAKNAISPIFDELNPWPFDETSMIVAGIFIVIRDNNTVLFYETAINNKSVGCL